ncbi:ligand-gated ion channel family protein [Christiangramia fulva]|uniref:Ligand-gated ion channel family protein n=2 Tax=Christiangramia fulva TaxID=2126553 RepID=A0A2R3ZB54_9FLAO|nr:ligand-gated ion channel family protein [Christiangramia fulva]
MLSKKLLFLFLFTFILNGLSAQDSLKIPSKLIIGVTETPPFIQKTPEGYTGLSIDSWKLVNEQLNFDYEFRQYRDLATLLNAIETGEVDLSVNPITVTDNRMKKMSFSQPYFISHTSVLKKKESRILAQLANLFSWDFVSVILLLILVIFIFGFLVWLFERKSNEEEFGSDLKGIMQGFWWSAVTMTTVGYGDKSPRTFGGRVIGFIWMFMAVIIISSFTAGIASSLTVKSINDEINQIQDLERFNVTTVNSSSSQELLDLYDIDASLVTNGEEGVEAILNGRASLFVYDEPILRYEIQRKELSDDLEILAKSLKKDYYSYAFPKNSPLLKIIDPVLVRSLKTMKWNTLTKDYY